MRDETLRSACFASLDVLGAEFGDEIPYKDGLDRGLPHGGVRCRFSRPKRESSGRELLAS